MKYKKVKKIIAQLLTATMCLSALPVSAMPAYAETAEPQDSSDENISVVSEDCADPAEPQTNLTSESTESDLTSPTAESDDQTGLTNEDSASPDDPASSIGPSNDSILEASDNVSQSNIPMPLAETVSETLDFTSGIADWSGSSGSDPTVSLSHKSDKHWLEADITFTNSSWQTAAVEYKSGTELDFSAYRQMEVDFYYATSDNLKDIFIQCPDISDTTSDINSDSLTEDSWTKTTVRFHLNENLSKVNGLKFEFKGHDNCPVNQSCKIYIGKITFSTPQIEQLKDCYDFAESDDGWAAGSWLSSDNGVTQIVSHDATRGQLAATLDFSNASDKDWQNTSVSKKNAPGFIFGEWNKMSLDFYYKPSDLQTGELALSAVAYADENHTVNILSGSHAFKASQNMEIGSDGYAKATIDFDLDTSKITSSGLPNELMLVINGNSTNFNGTVYIDNIKFKNVQIEKILPSYEFTDGAQNWGPGSWLTDGVTQAVWHDSDSKRLAADLDFSQMTNDGWHNSSISVTAEKGFDFSDYNKLTLDFYYKPSDMSKGSLVIRPIAEQNSSSENQIFIEQSKDVNNMQKTDAGGGYVKVSFTFDLAEANTSTVFPKEMLLNIVGTSTDFHGTVYVDNIRFTKEDLYVTSTIRADSKTNLSADADKLTVNGSHYPYETAASLVDKDATDATKRIYQYLKAIGTSDSVIYGHMEDTSLKAGYVGLSPSDTKDVTGSLSAIDGYDCGGSFSGFKDKYDKLYPGESWTGSTVQDDVRAAALLSKKSIEEGAVITLSSHMPNFAYAKLRADADSYSKSYEKYDYSGGDSYKVDGGECMKNILPGQKYNEAFTAHLDLIAEYAQSVDAPILFRPLHENTGGWFWWGSACSAETYKSVFKYTVEYLRDIKGIHNLIYVYAPGTESATEAEYGERYPGDGYVDMVGFDSYDSKPTADENYTFQTELEKNIQMISNFAKKHGKLFAITETGIANGDSCALLAKDNPRKDWYCEILNLAANPAYNCCYFMLWSNYSTSGNYYSPFVIKDNGDGTLYGHEMLDGFIRFYNDERSIFASDQKNAAYSNAIPVPNTSAADGGILDGYFTAPAEGSRIAGTTAIRARLSKELSAETADLKFVLSGINGQSIELSPTQEADKRTYTASLSAEQAASLDPAADGKLTLYANGRKLQELWMIINIAEPKEDPLVVDTFESYLGFDNLLAGKWATNKKSGSTLNISISQDAHSANGSYALKLSFSMPKGGYVGTEITKEADWSSCNALQFWVKPDGLNQKTVLQIKIGGNAYEAYLNQYDAYRNAQQPLLVTLPFSCFKLNGSGTALTSAAAKGLTGFGLWVNALDESFTEDGSMISGVLYYDDIKAISAEVTEPVFEPVSDAKDDNQSGQPQKPGSGSGSSGGSGGWYPSTPSSTGTPGASGSKPDASSDPLPQPIDQTLKNIVINAASINEDGAFTDANGELIRNAIVKAPDGHKYITDSNGKKRASGFVDTTDGTTYYIKQTGMVAEKEIIVSGDHKYFAKDSGAIAKSEFCTTAKGSLIYAYANGILASDKVITVGGKKYFAKKNCAIAKKGFYTTPSANLVYARKSGELITNRIFSAKGKKYFAKKSGAVAKGQFMRTASGSKIYAKKSGALATNGLFTVKGAKYYAKKSGAIVTKKWVKVGNKLYYCSASGKITKTKKAR